MWYSPTQCLVQHLVLRPSHSGGELYEQVASVINGIFSTNTVPGSKVGTKTFANANGELFEQVTRITKGVVSTHTVPGPKPGTEILANTNGEPFQQVTGTIVSAHTVTGPTAGKVILTNTEGDFYEQVTLAETTVTYCHALLLLLFSLPLTQKVLLTVGREQLHLTASSLFTSLPLLVTEVTLLFGSGLGATLHFFTM